MVQKVAVCHGESTIRTRLETKLGLARALRDEERIVVIANLEPVPSVGTVRTPGGTGERLGKVHNLERIDVDVKGMRQQPAHIHPLRD